MNLFPKKILLFFIFCFNSVFGFAQSTVDFTLPENVTENDYLKGKIILKIKPAFENYCSGNQIQISKLQNIFQTIDVVKIEKIFPFASKPEKKQNEFGMEYTDLSMIYQIEYRGNHSIEKAVNLIISSGCVAYAQPRYIQKTLDFTPSDPLNFNQYHLSLIKSFDAWDITKGDTNVVIGICDWGTDIDHPDLAANVKYNYLDPIDGFDNDNDGYTDNFMGWDLGDNDNNPQGSITHGCFVAGLSSAKTNNNIGLSGTGFMCKFLPVKICDSNNLGTKTYEGIVYAVEHGCSVVNCSWGNTFYTGPFGQDVINYATINKEALIVAASGNSNSAVRYYPASYNYVLSVAATNQQDIKWNGSTYGYFVDIAAPGESVWSTYDGGTYGGSSGTSFSAPIVAGCAALLKSKYPNLTGLQIGEKLKVTADNIYGIPQNQIFIDLLGTGRVNVFRALNDSVHPSICMFNPIISEMNPDGSFQPYDTLLISGTFVNFLAPSSAGLTAKIISMSASAAVIDSLVTLGSLGTLSSLNNQGFPFKVLLKPGTPSNAELFFKIAYADTNYTAYQFFGLTVNINYINVDTNKIATTITSEGMIGYNRGNSLQGVGFTYNNSETLLSSGGFLVGKSYTQVSDVIYGSTGLFDIDFGIIKNIARISQPYQADYEAAGLFDDSLALSTKINIKVRQKIFAWNEPLKDKFVIFQYTIINKNLNSINNIYAGLFMDWDIGNTSKNRTDFDPSHRMGYCFNIDGGYYTGISLLSNGALNHYAFDNNGNNGSIKISDGFTSNEKYSALKTTRHQAGMFATGNDVSQMLSSGPFSIAAGDSVTLVFALLAGEHLSDLQASSSEAVQCFYHTGTKENSTSAKNTAVLYQNTPNPFDNFTNFSFELMDYSDVELFLCNLKGELIDCIYKGTKNKGLHQIHYNKSLDPGVYILSLKVNNSEFRKKITVIK